MESDVPADPVAKGLAHHYFEVGAPQPGQFLREQRHALAPRTMHAGDIGAPEHAPRSERIEHPMQRVVNAVEYPQLPANGVSSDRAMCASLPVSLWPRPPMSGI
jgi:hypothetical protein